MKNKSVDMTITSHTVYTYQWECPHCGNHTERDENDSCQQYIVCPKCRGTIYRHGPGEYGTQKP